MSSDRPTPPTHLDEAGLQLWQTYIETGDQYREAKREFKMAHQAYRVQVSSFASPDPATLARYLAAQDAREQWHDAHTLAAQEYHAYTRRRIARILITPK